MVYNSATNERLCCCEYISLDGRRSHVLAVCCDCNLVDESFERCITCKDIPPGMCHKLCTVIGDRMRIPWCDGKGARHIDSEVAAAALLMPVSLLIASQGWEYMIFTFALLPLLLSVIYKKWLKNRSRTRFFLAWSLASLIFLMSVFEFEVVPYLEILFHENFILLCFVTVACVCGFVVRLDPGKAVEMFGKMNDRETKSSNDTVSLTLQEHDHTSKCQFCHITQTARINHCHRCGICVLRRDHHSLWLDTCIGVKNHRFYIMGLAALLASCIYGSGLAFTTICHPVKVFNLFLVPDKCTEVFGDFHMGLCFASAVYTAIIGIGVILTLLQQLWLICQNATVQEWKRGRVGVHSRGVCLNCKDFWCGCN